MTRSLLLLVALAAAASGQTRPVAKPETVYLDVTALDASGRFAAGLTAADFAVSRGGSPLKLVKAEAIDTRHSRSMVLLVDDLGLPFEKLRTVRTALRKFVAEQLQAGDRIAIARTSAGAGHLQRFTSDPALLNAATDLLQYNPLGESAATHPQSFAAGTLLQLQFVFDALQNTPGRKAVVLFSERLSLPRNAAADVQRDVENSAVRIAELAHQGMAALYVVQAARAPLQLETGVAGTVKETAGRWIDNTTDYSAALAEVWREQEGHYLVGWQPEAHSYDYRSGRDRFPEIAARTSRPGVTLRARTVVYGAPDEEPPDDDAAIRTAFAGDLALRATPRFSVSASQDPSIEVLLHIDAKRLTFVQSVNREYHCVVETWAAAFDAEGHASAEANRTGIFALSEEAYRRAREAGLVASVRIPVRKPGAYQIRTAILDDATARIGSASQYMEIPDLSKGALALSGILLIPAAATPAQVAAAAGVFKPGESLGYEYQVFNIRSGGEIQARVFREAEEIFAGQLLRIAETGTDVPARTIKGTMGLTTALAPGRYRFQVFAADKSPDQPRSATEFVDFEVRRF